MIGEEDFRNRMKKRCKICIQGKPGHCPKTCDYYYEYEQGLNSTYKGCLMVDLDRFISYHESLVLKENRYEENES